MASDRDERAAEKFRSFEEEEVKIQITLVDDVHATQPRRGSDGAAGYDVCARTSVSILPCSRALVPLGFHIALPKGWYGRIAPRSGLAVRNHIDIGAGVIDADYRGEVHALLINHHVTQAFCINPGDRIAQLVIERCITPTLVQVNLSDLGKTTRDTGGFGSSGHTWSETTATAAAAAAAAAAATAMAAPPPAAAPALVSSSHSAAFR